MTLAPFFAVAMLAPNRQRSFRNSVVLHVLLVSMLASVLFHNRNTLPLFGQLLLIVGIVEGAILVGWRLTQVPKSQALEFLLVSPVQPKNLFRAEAFVSLSRYVLVSATGLPIMALLVAVGRLQFDDLLVLLCVPIICGAATGLGMTIWAYESRAVRRVCEWIGLGCVLLYLVVGVLAGENLALWIGWLPERARWWFMEMYGSLHTYNLFAVMQFWFEPHRSPPVALERMLGLGLVVCGVIGLFMMRGAARLRGHFHDRHYRPLSEVPATNTTGPGDQPLTWWAVRRVMEYSGRVNIWLAGGFCVLYAAYTVAGDHWPVWMGRLVFQMVESVGGIPVVATALVVLAAVPACFQYGLWDSSTQARCRRLELLLLTDLKGDDYWTASAAAAWRRGRGYMCIAGMLWIASYLAGKSSLAQTVASIAAGVLLWGLFFSLGFWSFARGRQANGLSSLLTLGVPIGCIAIVRAGWPTIAALTPPGAVWYPLAVGPSTAWLPGPLLLGVATLVLADLSRRHCDRNLRAWYGSNHGRQGID